MNVEALKSFIISQGASRRVITMEWDKFWSENKSVLEQTSARYMGVTEDDMVPIRVTNVSEEVVAVSVQIHPQKPEFGNRVMRKSNSVRAVVIIVIFIYYKDKSFDTMSLLIRPSYIYNLLSSLT
jgi:glutamyl-tRNA synthetase